MPGATPPPLLGSEHIRADQGRILAAKQSRMQDGNAGTHARRRVRTPGDGRCTGRPVAASRGKEQPQQRD
ncbi:hypothetical protein AOB60_35665 [Streptomyces noursei]|uniref:Uncharacterized protein n=1 Tax=Streptomyces noursei TaxID=1971 RepID=A0A2N8PDZ8_STRNR|nr:hypothetical protein AOB60_35665 [Streptomyces noursei]